MSHVVKVELVITDLDALEKACSALGLTYDKTENTWRWYGTWVNDYSKGDAAYVHGITPDRYGKADAGIVRVPGCGWDIGVYKVPGKENTWCLIYDFYAGGHGIEKALGKALPDLNKAYGAEVFKKQMKAKGLQVAKDVRTRTANGRLDIKLEACKR